MDMKPKETGRRRILLQVVLGSGGCSSFVTRGRADMHRWRNENCVREVQTEIPVYSSRRDCDASFNSM